MTDDSPRSARVNGRNGDSAGTENTAANGRGQGLRIVSVALSTVALTAVLALALASLPDTEQQPGSSDAAEAPITATDTVASNPTPSPYEAALPSATLEQVESTPPDVTPPTGTVQERSDFFWNAVSGGDWHNIYGSLDEIVADSDLIVTGRIVELRFGENVRGFEVIRATVVLSEVLKGEPQSQDRGTITLQLPPVLPSERDAILSTVPEHPHLLFLHYAPSEAERDGVAESAQDDELYDYVMVNGIQGALRSIEDETRSLPGTDLTPFPSDLNGRPFDSVVADVRTLSSDNTATE